MRALRTAGKPAKLGAGEPHGRGGRRRARWRERVECPLLWRSQLDAMMWVERPRLEPNAASIWDGRMRRPSAARGMAVPVQLGNPRRDTSRAKDAQPANIPTARTPLSPKRGRVGGLRSRQNRMGLGLGQWRPIAPQIAGTITGEDRAADHSERAVEGGRAPGLSIAPPQ